MIKKFLSILFIVFSISNYAQELICEVNIVAPDASKVTADPKVFKTLENTVMEFMNNTKWTSEVFEENEKIECSIFIGVKEQSGNNYSATITIISKRPVYNSDYKTTVLNIIDNDFRFSYTEFEPIELGENQFISNLSHTLAFYANMVIAMDYESFSENGGEKYLLKAQELTTVVSAIEAGRYPGWKPASSNNKRTKYWLINNILNPRFVDYRKAIYTYYRLGLDNFYADPILARANIEKSLEYLAKISEDDPNVYIMQMWSETKSKETIEIYKEAPTAEKKSAVEILRKVDPVNAEKYNVILK